MMAEKSMQNIDETCTTFSFESMHRSRLTFCLGEDNAPSDRVHSISQLALAFGKRPTNDTILAGASGLAPSDSFRSFQDIFSTENSEQAKHVIMTGVRHELHTTRTISESGSDDIVVNKIDPLDHTAKPTVVQLKQSTRKPTMLLAGPKFRFHTVDPEVQLKRDTVYPVSVSRSTL